MENLEWLKKLQRDDDSYSDIETNEYGFRMAKATEIIAKELIGIKEELNLIASYVMAIKNLQ